MITIEVRIKFKFIIFSEENLITDFGRFIKKRKIKSQRGSLSAVSQPTVLPDPRSSLFGKIPNVNVDVDVDIDVNVDANVNVNVDMHCMHCISATNCVTVRFNLRTLQKSPILVLFYLFSRKKKIRRSSKTATVRCVTHNN